MLRAPSSATDPTASSEDAAPLTSVQRRRLRKLNAIMDAAELLVQDVGLDGLTMAKVAAEVDMTAGALYRYFPGKEQMFVQMQVRALAEIEDRLSEALAAVDRRDAAVGAGGKSPLFALARVVSASAVHRDYAEQRPARFSLLAMGLSEQRDLVADGGSTEVWQGVARLLGDIGALIDEAVASGALNEGDRIQRALCLMMGGQGLLQLAKMNRHVPDLPSPGVLAQQLCRDLLTGWGADPTTLRDAESLA